MKRYFLCSSFLFYLSLGHLAAQRADTLPPAGYALVWAEEFLGTGGPDPRFWSFEHGFVRNRELQWYQSANARLEGGLLLIEGRRESVVNPAFDETSKNWKTNRPIASYTSSSIHTRGKFSFRYGILEVRAKIATDVGLWPAIWTLGVDGDWPANGEIDVMEYYLVEGEPTLLANAAWAHPDKRAAWDEAKIPLARLLAADPDWVEKFHVWKLEWTADYLRIYLDEHLLNEVDLSSTVNPDGTNPFRQPHYILLNLAIGGNGGDPAQSVFPADYRVDYVRVYQKDTPDDPVDALQQNTAAGSAGYR
ncbi:Beta-glucanase, GH16 family [Cyclobacterium xiamenense]|uniref:Beta-glucanase, GH16 family n=1 Tax=Cyclobacterium xiamenense TaxID=1297121 RepID=A0A1H6YWB6_9BACT|nr:glycoside hydrolase family 16 protein [Cyclobacterium xiamenense]SEJ41600.1 Beta-glucanase, GH16 family [Cyclobacterium xiamenense]